ncbi:MAG TPA: 3-phosphoshikimate 1-carboxyvinyltransferase [Acidimicrobiales bacterium]|nr:3-phosphoshikimate 1-carboxyvinyltransferase [Acidimicrobiales bacterium]
MSREPISTGAEDAMQVRGGNALVGSVHVPGDKSISHRALLLAALAEGESTITGLSDGDDVHRTLVAIRALGAEVTEDDGTVRVIGGRARLHSVAEPLDLGNSGTGMRLMAGVLAGIEGTTVLTGDASLMSRPMDRVAEPLEEMGASVAGQGERCLPPVEISGGHLRAIDYRPPMASAQVKSAVLLAGVAAEGETVVREPVPTRTHTEDMLARAGATISVTDEGGDRVIRVQRSDLRPGTTSVPGDPSQAAFWIVGGLVVPGSTVTVSDVYLGPQRTGFLDVLRRMGADIEVRDQSGETGTVVSRTSALRGTEIRAEEIPSLDEVPILAVAAAVAEGRSRFLDVGELRIKESDRLAGTVVMLDALGAEASVDGDDLIVTGGATIRAAQFDSAGDHRMAMAMAIAGTACPSSADVTTISGWGSVGTSYPRFSIDLSTLSEPRAEGT